MQKTQSADRLLQKAKAADSVHESIRRRIRECPYAYYFNRVDWQLEDHKVRLRGAVQSFYLKQVLQELVRDLDEVDQIVNEVDVVNSTGLSSVRPR